MLKANPEKSRPCTMCPDWVPPLTVLWTSPSPGRINFICSCHFRQPGENSGAIAARVANGVLNACVRAVSPPSP